MNKNEDKIFIESLLEIDKSLREINTSLLLLSNNLYAIKNFLADPDKLSKSKPFSSNFPNLYPDKGDHP